jgi:hypothetical protein
MNDPSSGPFENPLPTEKPSTGNNGSPKKPVKATFPTVVEFIFGGVISCFWVEGFVIYSLGRYLYLDPSKAHGTDALAAVIALLWFGVLGLMIWRKRWALAAGYVAVILAVLLLTCVCE